MFKVRTVYGVNTPIIGKFDEVDASTGEVTNHITVLRDGDNRYKFVPHTEISAETANKLIHFLSVIL